MVMLGSNKKYLKADLCNNGDVVQFMDEGVWVDSAKYTYDDGSPRKSFEMTVLHNDQDEYTLTLNVTNRNNLIPAFGYETKEWVGKQATIEKIKVSVASQLKDSILLSPVAS